MAVTGLQRTGGEGYSGDSNGKRTYTRTYLCVHGLEDTLFSVLNNTVFPIPKVGDQHPDDKGCYVKTVTAGEVSHGDKGMKNALNASSLCREVVVTYENTGTANYTNINQLTKERGAYNVSLDVVSYPKVLRKQFTAKGYALSFTSIETREAQRNTGVKNTAGEFLSVETTGRNSILRFDYDTKTYDQNWQWKFVGSVNQTAMVVAGFKLEELKAKLLKLCPTVLFDTAGNKYYDIAVEVEIENGNPVRYQEVLNAGYKFKSGGKLQPIYTDGLGTYGAKSETLSKEVSEPYPLNDTGGLLTGWVTDISVKETYLKVYDTWTMDWTALGFPDEAKERRNRT
jgi:hypothetical protein